jgi:kynurenine formamidase
MAKIIDLSLPFGPKGGLGGMRTKPEVKYISHEESVQHYSQVYGMKADDFPDGKYCAVEKITLSTHDTTHLDAPWHYSPVSEGKPSKTIDQIPLEWCYGDGVVLDFHHKKKGELITGEEVREALAKIGYRLKPFDIVLIRTDVSKHYQELGYDQMHPGMTAEATLWLIRQGIKVMGIDAYGWDRSHEVMVKEFKKGNKEQFWEAHFVGKEAEYCHLERLANLDEIPRPFGFKVAVFPIKIERASAGWVRAVAIFED